MENSLPAANDSGPSYRHSYDMSSLLLADGPRQMADYVALSLERQMRDYRLPDQALFFRLSKGIIKRRFIVEDRF